jgi:hypothetical protein
VSALSIVAAGERRGTNELSAHVPSQTPNYFISTASSWLVRREKQRKVIGYFEAVRLKPDTAVGIVLYQAGMLFAHSEHDGRYLSKQMAR